MKELLLNSFFVQKEIENHFEYANYILILSKSNVVYVTKYSPIHKRYMDTWILKTIEELKEFLTSNHFTL